MYVACGRDIVALYNQNRILLELNQLAWPCLLKAFVLDKSDKKKQLGCLRREKLSG